MRILSEYIEVLVTKIDLRRDGYKKRMAKS